MVFCINGLTVRNAAHLRLLVSLLLAVHELNIVFGGVDTQVWRPLELTERGRGV